MTRFVYSHMYVYIKQTTRRPYSRSAPFLTLPPCLPFDKPTVTPITSLDLTAGHLDIIEYFVDPIKWATRLQWANQEWLYWCKGRNDYGEVLLQF